MVNSRFSGLLLSFIYALGVVMPLVYAHEEHHGYSHGSMSGITPPPPAEAVNSTLLGAEYHALDSYYLWKEDKFLLYSHVVTMVISWVFVLPLVLAFGLSRSRLYYPTQLAFVGGNVFGVTFSTLYNVRTPDLYPNNVHHKLGWMIMGLLTIHSVMGMLWRRSLASHGDVDSKRKPEGAYTPLYTPADEEEELDDLVVSPRRASGDSGLGAERSSSSSELSNELGHSRNYHRRRGLNSLPQVIGSTRVGSFLQRQCPYILTPSVMQVNDIFFSLILRLLPIIGFVQITAGLVVVTGVFVGSNVLNGLAHTIKGGIFFWYGVLTFGRFLGAFGEYGWAWNIRPLSNSKWAKRVPSCEMVESSLILFYGSIDVFLEHLTAWGHAWTHMDLEHESIAILFFGGGLCGVLLESKAVMELLYPTPREEHRQGYIQPLHQSLLEHSKPQETKPTYNILPALVLFLLGKSMSEHHQSSSLSVALHTQWGQLLSYAGVARVITYILLYISPPRSTMPPRPPTEAVASFCLMAGGLIFMLSNKDSVAGFEKYEYEGLFIFTLISALAAFFMGWITVFMAVKGWGMRRSQGT